MEDEKLMLLGAEKFLSDFSLKEGDDYVTRDELLDVIRAITLLLTNEMITFFTTHVEENFVKLYENLKKE